MGVENHLEIQEGDCSRNNNTRRSRGSLGTARNTLFVLLRFIESLGWLKWVFIPPLFYIDISITYYLIAVGGAFYGIVGALILGVGWNWWAFVMIRNEWNRRMAVKKEQGMETPQEKRDRILGELVRELRKTKPAPP